MRPKLLERFKGYVMDIDAETFFLICERQNEQLEIPLAHVQPNARMKLREGSYANMLVYENRVSFRLMNVGRWTAAELKCAKRRGRKLHKLLTARLEDQELALPQPPSSPAI